MDDQIAKIYQQPACFGVAFNFGRNETVVFFSVMNNIFSNRFQLAIILAITDEKEVGKNSLLP